MEGFIPFMVVAAVILTAIVLLVGVAGFARGGEFNQKYGNKLMRLRILMQGIAIVLICIAIYASR